jgi:quercetin dioxygenase-like cupin family protein
VPPDTLHRMKPRDIRDLVWFADDTARHETLFETDQLWAQVVCLQNAQALGPMSDAGSDAMAVVLTGEVAVQVGKTRARMGQWESVLVPHGDELTIRNASQEPAVVLLTLAPPPASTV